MNRYSIKKIVHRYYFFIVIFISILFLLVYFFYYNLEKKKENYLNSLVSSYNFEYESIYRNFKKLSTLTFYNIINKPEISNHLKNAYGKDIAVQKYHREKLYEEFFLTYTRLKSYQFEQFHFHFPNNISFLRMHKPEQFGDDLSSSRVSVVKVNQKLEPVEGVEIGKVSHGFRFVYPLFDEQLNHIGSAEASIPLEYFEREFEKAQNIDTHFLINKKFSTDTLFSKELQKEIVSVENNEYFIIQESKNENFHFVSQSFYTQNELDDIQKRMQKGESFILYKKSQDAYLAIYFKNIQDIKKRDGSAYLVIYNNSEYLKQLYGSYYEMHFIILALLILFIYLVFKVYKYDIKQERRDKILTQQSKMASMGEMINNIAHQWRQPLATSNMAISILRAKNEMDILEKEYLKNKLDEIEALHLHMSDTIEDFRSFFNKNKKKERFNLKEIIEQSIAIFDTSFSSKNINIIENIEDIELVSYQNELKQIIINLLKNSLDAIGENGIIMIFVSKQKNRITINLKDSGGGIQLDLMSKIFEPYFTTKHQSVGTGLGLFMSHEIVNKSLHGTIDVKNETFSYQFKNYFGASFTIMLDEEKL